MGVWGTVFVTWAVKEGRGCCSNVRPPKATKRK